MALVKGLRHVPVIHGLILTPIFPINMAISSELANSLTFPHNNLQQRESLETFI